ncbi:hypothetical protein C8R42DRAFT_681091 [Lentinula raphanica]|nr:hypothetical protein C8R42DRAFT_681091 [Lentinula raphanica]
MPRILPRLLKKLEETLSQEGFDDFNLNHYRFRGKSLWKPPPPNPYPSFKPSDYPKSILLEPQNPITSSRDYNRRKTLPPRVYLPERAQKRKNDLFDSPRRMSEEERGWWASPYLRMLSSPLRRCFQTQQLLPSAFLIRLGVFQAPSCKPSRFITPNSPPEAVLLPDGLEHSKFRARRSGKGGYILCWKDAIERSRISGTYKRIVFNARLPSILDQIRHLLRLRVLQELQLVVDALRFRPLELVDKDRPLIRRLSRTEWHQLRTTGVMPDTVTENVMAVIVVPPLNRHPVTKERPKGLMSSLPTSFSDTEESKPPKFHRPALPLCTLHPTRSSDSDTVPQTDPPHVDFHSQTPLYNGVSLFPDPSQRAMLLKLLCRVLTMERNARAKLTRHEAEAGSSNSPTSTTLAQDKKDDESQASNRASHAFVLCSDAHAALSADMASVGLALWRIPMFEGFGWDTDLSARTKEDGVSEIPEGDAIDNEDASELFESPWVERYKYRSMFGDERYRVRI